MTERRTGEVVDVCFHCLICVTGRSYIMQWGDCMMSIRTVISSIVQQQIGLFVLFLRHSMMKDWFERPQSCLDWRLGWPQFARASLQEFGFQLLAAARCLRGWCDCRPWGATMAAMILSIRQCLRCAVCKWHSLPRTRILINLGSCSSVASCNHHHLVSGDILLL